MKFRILSGLFLLSIISVQAQEKRWTLRECVYYALEHNISVQQSELDLESIKLDKSDAIGNLLPNLNASASYSASTGLSQDPTTGILVNQTFNSLSGGITSSVGLFDGLRNYKQVKRAEVSALAAQYQLDGMKDDISLMVANNYLQILSNKETLKTLQAQYRVSQQDYQRTEQLVENGVLPKGDLLEIEATVATQEQQIVNAENNVLISRIALAQLLQISDYENFDVVDEGYMIPESDILNHSADEIYAKSLNVMNSVKSAEVNVEIAELDVKIAQGARYPTLGGYFNYNTRYNDQNDLSFKDQLWFYDGISYGLQLSVPIFNGNSVRNNIRRSRINLEKTQLSYEQSKLDLESNVNQAYVDVKGSLKSYQAANKTVEARRLSYEYAKERYNVGLMNSFDFSQAQARMDDAEAELIRTKYDYIFRLKVLEFYFGIPLDEL
ncbi:TolC family protein [Robertkochia solimangrovi]|uniref:TolC family protein n=1 Tax=Robertkochia solimangrovi TaxID=2213046 RepID=UPI0011806BE3|nr:TolC family protein [Robertkochia solimangrovi]TRZ45768.1 TolC family protein [Robertkochia solimangrovi]